MKWLLIILVIAGIGGGGYYFYKKSPNKEAADPIHHGPPAPPLKDGTFFLLSQRRAKLGLLIRFQSGLKLMDASQNSKWILAIRLPKEAFSADWMTRICKSNALLGSWKLKVPVCRCKRRNETSTD